MCLKISWYLFIFQFLIISHEKVNAETEEIIFSHLRPKITGHLLEDLQSKKKKKRVFQLAYLNSALQFILLHARMWVSVCNPPSSHRVRIKVSHHASVSHHKIKMDNFFSSGILQYLCPHNPKSKNIPFLLQRLL